MSDPQPLGKAISELIALRGWAREQGNQQLISLWEEVAGELFASQTTVLGIRRSVLQIGVHSSPLLSELVAFHQQSLLQAFQKTAPHLKIRQIKFRLQSK